jgi:hypothetical protein
VSTSVYDITGTLVERWDDVSRKYTDFRTDPDTVRNYTPEENARADAEAAEATLVANEAELIRRAKSALTGNATFLALGSPTNAQTLAQVRALTRQVNALIKLTARDLTDIAGT